MFTKEQEEFIENYVKALREKNAVVFAGAGMSIPCGFLNWKKLLDPIAKKMGLDIEEEHDLTALAQLYVDNNSGVRGRLNQLLEDSYGKIGVKGSINHEILARLPIEIYWTTNYDNLIEEALISVGKTPDVKSKHTDLTINKPKRDAIVYKMHGDIKDVAETVLTKHEYEDYNEKREYFSNAFKNDLISKTFLFIGFSFTDPNLDYLISRIRTAYKQNVRGDDYYFIQKETDPRKLNKQGLQIVSLMRYGLNPVVVDNYEEDIPRILKEIEIRYLRNTILISGSAEEYGHFEEKEAGSFLHNLSKEISKNSYKILSGFGWGVGSAVINGVLDNMESERVQRLDDYLLLRPFPQFETGNKGLNELWTDYRKNFIPLAGIALFIFGNKKNKDTGEIILADGMFEEFDIAMNRGLKVIPIGATGYVAEDLWQRVMNDFDKYYSEETGITKEDFQIIGNKDLSDQELISSIIKIINKLNKR